MAYLFLSADEEVQILESILMFLTDSESQMSISDDPLPVYGILDYTVTYIPLLKTLKVETEFSYTELVSSEETAVLFEEVVGLLTSAAQTAKRDEKNDFMSKRYPKK